jgi:superfamily I DNA and/or RNA helicase/serine/threonine protein kinase
MSLVEGRILDNRYCVIRSLGEGGFGAAYLVQDLQLQRQCVAKASTRHDTAHRDQFEDEARLLARLKKHPNLPMVHNFFVDEDIPYLIMEYIEGETLDRKATQRSTPFEIADVLRWARDLLDALDYLHGEQPPIFHRDIKPSNICITPASRAVLLDFSIARSAERKATQTAAQAQSQRFSPIEQYSAEDAAGSSVVKGFIDELKASGFHSGPYSDIYSLGATLYFACTLKHPPDARFRVIEDELCPIVEKSEVPEFIARALDRALVVDPRQRCRTAREMRDLLSPLPGGESGPSDGTQIAGAARRDPDHRGTRRTLRMAKRINGRYVTQIEIPEVGFCEAWLAEDLQSPSTDYVRLYLVPTLKAGSLIHNVVQQRAAELTRFSHPSYLPMLDYGYDGANGCYYFVYPLRDASWSSLGRTLDKYLLHVQPGLDWCCEILLKLADSLNDLHARAIAHSQLRTSGITVDPLSGRISISHPGLASLVALLEGESESRSLASFEEAAQEDIRDFGRIVAEMISRRPAPTASELEEAIRAHPVNIHGGLEQLVGDPVEHELFSFADIKRTLEHVIRQLASEDTYYLYASNKAVERLHEYGFISPPRNYVANDFLQQECDRGVYAQSEEDRDGQGRVYRLTTSQMRLFCKPDRNTKPPRHLTVVGVQVREPGDLAIDRENGLRIDARLRLQHYAHVPQQSDVTSLLQVIDAHMERHQAQKDSELQDKSRFDAWQEVLDAQQRRLKAFRLRYTEWEVTDNGAAIQLVLEQPPPEDEIDLSKDDLLCMTSSQDGRQWPAGYLEDLTGNILKLGLESNVDTDQFRSSGLVTVDNRQAEAVLYRQTRAMKRLRFGETVNPNLLRVLAEPEQLVIDNPTAVDFWFQEGFLDDSQKKAVRRALATRDMFLIQGPPGTGKTSVIAELVLQILQRQEQARILITSQSNVAVNHALGRILKLRPELKEYVVRIGREEKADTTEELLVDRQLQAWGERVIERSNAYLARLEAETSGGERLSNALGMLAECEELSVLRQQRQDELVRTQARLDQLEAEYDQLERAMSRTGELRQQAEGILATAAPEDERLRQAIRSFQQEYLDWASAFLEQANRVAGISFQCTELSNLTAELSAKIKELSEDIEAGSALVNEFLQGAYEVSFETLSEQRAFMDQFYAEKQAEMARLGRLRRLVDDWKRRVGKDHRDFEPAYLAYARVVGATCIGVAAKGAMSELEFDWVIVDEAGRATHPELLVPVVRGAKIVLVGDHRQLPPIISRDLDGALEDVGHIQRDTLETSLFQELIEGAADLVHLPLDVQYRMHPAIGTLIGNCFYSDLGLQNGVDADERDHGLSWCPHSVIWYSTERLPNHSEVPVGHSKRNEAEIDAIVRLLDQIEASYAEADVQDKTIGIITGYLAQKAALRQRISAMQSRWPHLEDNIEVNTVDAYQGRERDIIIYSVVRCNVGGKIGFLRDERRLNVALSRARELLIIVGDVDVEFAKVDGINPFYTVVKHIRSHPEDCVLEVMEA